MVTISKSLGSVLVGLVAFGTATMVAHAGNAAPTQVVKAGRGISLDVGAKKVAGYFIATSGACDVTLMFADRMDVDGHVTGDVGRQNVSVKAGSTARVYTSEGRVIELSCGLASTVMAVRSFEQTAAVAK